MLVELITLLLVGGLLVAFGLLLWKKQKIELLHDYHYRNVRPEDKGPYTRLVGQGLLCMGAGILLTGVVDFAFQTQKGWAFFLVGSLLGLLRMNRAQKTYNGSWFS